MIWARMLAYSTGTVDQQCGSVVRRLRHGRSWHGQYRADAGKTRKNIADEPCPLSHPMSQRTKQCAR